MIFRSRITTFSLLVALLGTATTPAFADEPKPLSETLTGMAKADYAAGRVLFEDRDYSGALVKFQSAYESSKNPRLLWNVAACEKELRHYAKVLTMLREYREKAAAELTEQDKREVDELVQNIQPLVSSVEVTVNESGAEVRLDDDMIGTSPLAKPVLVDIGQRRVSVKKKGFREYNEALLVKGGAELAVRVKLERDVHEGTVTVRAPQGAAIVVDGKSVGSDTWTGKVSAGGHSLRVSQTGYRTYQTDFFIQDNGTRTLDVVLDAESRGVPAWMWIGGGVLLAGGAAVGGYLLLKPKETTGDPQAGTIQPGTVQLPMFR